ncbi:biotin--[acetyl-CoA-carboxylase] ligase [Chloroflexota bacterium]
MVEDNLSSELVTKGLSTRFVGQRVIYRSQLTSTMKLAREQARQGVAEGTVIITDKQTAGRGRINRVWLSPKGNLAVSIILRPELTHLPSLIMLASLAVVHSINKVTGLNPQIKWPNDVLINDKKVSGILIENDVKANKVNHTIIGIGVNINLKLTDFPEIQAIATSLSDELGKKVSRLSVLRSLLAEIERLYLVLTGGGCIYEEWRDNMLTLGKKVRVETGDSILEGVAESVDRDGSLCLRGVDGGLIKIVVGDVTRTTQ